MARHDYNAEAHVLMAHFGDGSFEGLELRSRGTLGEMIQYVMRKPSHYRRQVCIYVPESGDCLNADEMLRSLAEADEA